MPAIECPDCGGVGYLLRVGSRWSSSQEQWYPDEQELMCEECVGTGSREDYDADED